MPVPERSLTWPSLLALVVVLVGAAPALAYVGPGAGLELVGYFMSLMAWLTVAFSAVFFYPVYGFIRRLRGKQDSSSQNEASTHAGEPG